MALVGFSFAAALIYRWYVGTCNRSNFEDQLAEESPLHPYESNELRSGNSMTCDQFVELENQCRREFPDGLATYQEFVSFMKSIDLYKVKGGYLLDRIVLGFIQREKGSDVKTRRYPISFFLVALTNVIDAAVDDRVELLFHLAKHLSSEERDFLANDVKEGSSNEIQPWESDDEKELYCSQDNITCMVKLLNDAYQIPYEKKIQESEEYIPFKLFRKKRASEMVSEGLKGLKPAQYKKGFFSIDEFAEVICGPSVCVWGECYRKN